MLLRFDGTRVHYGPWLIANLTQSVNAKGGHVNRSWEQGGLNAMVPKIKITCFFG